MYLMMVTGQGLWLVYGLVIMSPAIIGSNVVAITLVGWVLMMKVRDLRRARLAAPTPAAAPAE
jgi:uncharacterized protein with PQ loop repeat